MSWTAKERDDDRLRRVRLARLIEESKRPKYLHPGTTSAGAQGWSAGQPRRRSPAPAPGSLSRQGQDRQAKRSPRTTGDILFRSKLGADGVRRFFDATGRPITRAEVERRWGPYPDGRRRAGVEQGYETFPLPGRLSVDTSGRLTFGGV